MLLTDFKNKYSSAKLDKFTFVNDSYGGYIKWKVDGTTIMSYDDPTGKTWTDGMSTIMKNLLWKDLGLEGGAELSSYPKSLTFTNQSYPIPAVPFDNFASDVTKMLTMMDIYVTDTKKFTARFPNIFKQQVATFKSGEQSRKLVK